LIAVMSVVALIEAATGFLLAKVRKPASPEDRAFALHAGPNACHKA
jgi:hypothetical protein